MIAYESIWNKHISGSPRTGLTYRSYLGRIQNPKSIRVSRGVEDKGWLATIGAKPIDPPENKGRSPERSWDWKTIRLLFEVFSLLLGKVCSFVGVLSFVVFWARPRITPGYLTEMFRLQAALPEHLKQLKAWRNMRNHILLIWTFPWTFSLRRVFHLPCFVKILFKLDIRGKGYVRL